MANWLYTTFFSAIVLCVCFSIDSATVKSSEYTRQDRVNYLFQCMLLRRIREDLADAYLPTIRRYTDKEKISFDDFLEGCNYLEETVLKKAKNKW